MGIRNKIIPAMILSVAIIGLNIFLYKTRDKTVDPFDNMYTYQDDYGEIYTMSDSIHISGFDISSRDALIVKLDGVKTNKWKIISGDESYENIGKYPIITLKKGVYEYFIFNDKDKVLDITLQYVPAEKYKESGFLWKDVYVVHDTSRPICRSPKYSIEGLASAYAYDKDETDRASKLIKESVDIKTSDSTEQKVIKISRFILDNVDNYRGVPSDTLSQMTPLEQFEYVRAGNVMAPQGFWCSNFADIYCFFANIAGVHTRRVDAYGNIDNVDLSGHAFTETYFSEKQQWGYVDLNDRKLFIKNGEGDYLSARDIQNVISVKVYNGLEATMYKAGSIVKVPYGEFAFWEEPYLSRRALLRYYYINGGRERSWKHYVTYFFAPDDLVRQYVKLFALYGLFTCVAVWFYAIAIVLMKRVQK